MEDRKQGHWIWNSYAWPCRTLLFGEAPMFDWMRQGIGKRKLSVLLGIGGWQSRLDVR